MRRPAGLSWGRCCFSFCVSKAWNQMTELIFVHQFHNQKIVTFQLHLMHLRMNCCDQALTRDMDCCVKHILSNQKWDLCANCGRHVKSAKCFMLKAVRMKQVQQRHCYGYHSFQFHSQPREKFCSLLSAPTEFQFRINHFVHRDTFFITEINGGEFWRGGKGSALLTAGSVDECVFKMERLSSQNHLWAPSHPVRP